MVWSWGLQKFYYLEGFISAEGHMADPIDTAALRGLKKTKPKTVRDVKKVICALFCAIVLMSWIFHYLQNPWMTHHPHRAHTRYSEGAKKGENLQNTVTWTSQHEDIMKMLVDKLAQALVMAYQDFTQPFLLPTHLRIRFLVRLPVAFRLSLRYPWKTKGCQTEARAM